MDKSELNRDFQALTLCHIEQLFRLAYARTNNTQDAEDIVQETYMKAYRSFHKFRHETSVKNWLTQILINTVRDHHRKGTRVIPTINIDDAPEESISHHTELSWEQSLGNDEIDPVLAKALQNMPDTLLVPLLLREIQEATYEEIARVLDIPIGTVMSRLFRARALLRKQLSTYVKENALSNLSNIPSEHL